MEQRGQGCDQHREFLLESFTVSNRTLAISFSERLFAMANPVVVSASSVRAIPLQIGRQAEAIAVWIDKTYSVGPIRCTLIDKHLQMGENTITFREEVRQANEVGREYYWVVTKRLLHQEILWSR
jgi:hypothetical protein